MQKKSENSAWLKQEISKSYNQIGTTVNNLD